jgi:chaperonin GroES
VLTIIINTSCYLSNFGLKKNHNSVFLDYNYHTKFKSRLRRSTVGIKPLGDRVLIEVMEEELPKQGSLYIPDTAKEKPQQGKVLAVGKGRYEDGKWIPLDVKVGDTVLFGKYAGTEVKYGGKEYLIVRENDILAIFE